MRLILIGCEYSGKTTLANAIEKWGAERGRQFHMDDHFSIPDQYHTSVEEQKAMTSMLPTLKERFQRFQCYYHLDVMEHQEDIVLAGFHIEEAIYGPRYYYPGKKVGYTRLLEARMPPDTILVLLTAQPEVIHARMKSSPHQYQLVKPSEVEEIQAQFEAEFKVSRIKRKTRLDVSDLKPSDLLVRFFAVVRPKLDTRDLLLMG
jgi:thymidylate kinase